VSRIYVLFSAIALLLAGCATSVTDASPHINHDPSILEWGIVGPNDVPTLDPALASDATSFSVASLIYGGLVRLDSGLHVQPDGAASWNISRDGKVYTFHIRPNLRFSDGRNVTAQDFVGALDRALGSGSSGGPAPLYLGLIGDRTATVNGQTVMRPEIDAIDSSTLRITLSRPAAHFLSELAFPVSFVPDPAVTQLYGASWTDHAAGFGPFFVKEWRHTRFLELVPNQYYYAGRPALKGITLSFYQPTAALLAYQHGKLDMITGSDPGTTLPSSPTGTRRVPGLALDYLAFNTQRLPFFRLNARRAFASVWSPSFVATAMGTTAFPAGGFLPSGFGLAVPRWTASADGKTYLRRARFPRPSSFPPVTLIMPRDPYVYALARRLQLVWKSRLGIDVGLAELNTSNYGTVLSNRGFDIAIIRWGADYPDPQDFLGTQLGPSPDNVTGWTRLEFDKSVLVADSYNPLDSRRVGLFRKAAKLAAQKLPLLPLDEPAFTGVIRPELKHVALTALGTVSGDWTRAAIGR
jgi:oligopeptide transport system substrate-binding protein